MQKIVQIVGPTAVGKTDLAVSIAKKFDGMLISADSVQVYKGLDIISGKDIPKDSKFEILKDFDNKFQLGFYKFSKIPIYNLDVVDPITSFNVSDFKYLAHKFISHITSHKKLPIVVGGTGLYLNALIGDTKNLNISPDAKLRLELGKLDLATLQKKLKSLDPEKFSGMNNSDINNSRRLIRAIEISMSKNNKKQSPTKNNYSVLQIGLMAPKEFLKEKINKRVEKRIETGALKEAESLFKNYDDLSSQVKNANGYKQLFAFLKKETNWEDAVYLWKISEYRHAKNQMTWFKKYGNTVWFDITKKDFKKEIDNKIKSFLS